MSPLFFDKKSYDTSERVADTVANMVENFVKQIRTISKKSVLPVEILHELSNHTMYN